MNTPVPPNSPSDDREQWLTSWLLGELPPDEAAKVEALLAADPKFRALQEQLSHAIGLVKEALKVPGSLTPSEPASLKLSPSRRELLLSAFQAAPRRSRRPWAPVFARFTSNVQRVPFREWATVAALLVLVVSLTATLLPAIAKSKSLAMGRRPASAFKADTDQAAPISPNEVMYHDGAESERAQASVPLVMNSFHLPLNEPVPSPSRGLAEKPASLRPLTLGDSMRDSTRAEQPKDRFNKPTLQNGRQLGRQEEAKLAPITRAKPNNENQQRETYLGSDPVPLWMEEAPKSVPNNNLRYFRQDTAAGDSVKEAKEKPGAVIPPPPGRPVTPALPALTGKREGALVDSLAVTQVERGLLPGGSEPRFVEGGGGGGVGSFTLPGKAPSLGLQAPVDRSPNSSFSKIPNQASEAKQLDDLKRLRKSEVEVESVPTEPASAGVSALNSAVQDQEDIASPGAKLQVRLQPLPEKVTAQDPFSTFSLNVSDVSFRLTASALQKKTLPPTGSLRTEEFINAFDYRDPEAAPGQPIAFAFDQARHPSEHNRNLLRLSIKTAAKGRGEGRPLNLVLLLDHSGSMERADRQLIIRECLSALAEKLKPTDRISVVGFSRNARLWIDGMPGSQAGTLVARLGELTPEGGTNLEGALDVAYQTALRHFIEQGDNRVVVLTDGAANLGTTTPELLRLKVEAHRTKGIALDSFGIGWEGYNDVLLESLARNGDGRYAFLDQPQEARTDFARLLAGALEVAASDVKVQVEFNPRRVTTYRQIGYISHQLTAEQFRDNTVDAAELGAAEAGNALYSLQVDSRGEGPLGTVRVRYKIPGTSSYREQAWALPYTSAVPALEHAAPAMRLSSVAALFSEWLNGSPQTAEMTTSKFLHYLRGVPQAFSPDSRPSKLETMIRQAAAQTGR